MLAHKQGVFEWHQRGYLHRDIKPDNVRVSAEGDVVIIDANIAKPISKCARGKVTRKRKAAGTTGFMDPLVENGVYDWSPAAEVWNVGLMLGLVRCHRATTVALVPLFYTVACARCLQLVYLNMSPIPSSVRRLEKHMMRPQPSQRPCLGTVLFRKCRAENGGVCDGSKPEKCLYGSADSPSELGNCFRLHLGLPHGDMHP